MQKNNREFCAMVSVFSKGNIFKKLPPPYLEKQKNEQRKVQSTNIYLLTYMKLCKINNDLIYFDALC